MEGVNNVAVGHDLSVRCTDETSFVSVSGAPGDDTEFVENSGGARTHTQHTLARGHARGGSASLLALAPST